MSNVVFWPKQVDLIFQNFVNKTRVSIKNNSRMENISFKVPEPSEYSKVLEAFEDYFTKRKCKPYKHGL